MHTAAALLADIDNGTLIAIAAIVIIICGIVWLLKSIR